MSEKIEVYTAIRSELVAVEEMQRKVWIYMYVLFCTLFVLGLQWSHYLFLVSYIVLIPFQCVINDYQWSISKMSIYLRTFFEKENIDMNWESLHISDVYKDYYNQKKKSVTGVIRISGAAHLGFLATGFYCGYTLNNRYEGEKFAFNEWDIILIVLSVLLFSVILFINKDFYKDYGMDLEKVIEEYKKSITTTE